MEYIEKKNSRYGLLATVMVHAVLFVLFLIFGLTVPVPIPQQNIVINFGNSADGTGPVQPDQSAATNATPDQPSPSQQTSTPTYTPEEVVTQDNESPVQAPKETAKQPTKEPVKEPEREVNQQALFPGKRTPAGGGSEGETGKPGDQGDPSGDRNSMSHTGGLDGSGNSYSLGMRKALVKPKPEYNCPEEGRVVVNISVDRNGKVLRATPGGRGTTNAAPCLLERAKEAAMETRWEADANAPEMQSGQIIYKFELR